MDRPPESFKSFANRLARRASTVEARDTLRLLRLAGVSGTLSVPTGDDSWSRDSHASAAPLDAGRVGVWERKVVNGRSYYARSMAMFQEWHLWANIGRIQPKGRKKRVVLLGESVARGYLYDPEFTPAMVLSDILETQIGRGEIEVIDLACTDLGFGIGETALSAHQLEPDILLMFCGNNWGRPSLVGLEIDAVLPDQGIPGLKSLVEHQLTQRAATLIKRVNRSCQDRGIPIIWIIPEFNLSDWREPETIAPHLADGSNAAWIRHCDAASYALSRNDYKTAEKHAQRMTELDKGTTPRALYILADCKLGSSNQSEARTYLEQAKDSLIWDPSRYLSPRPFCIVQNTIRSIASQGGYVVDLPKQFQEHLKGEGPDRRLFLDYCHLTVEGIHIAMAAAARCVLQHFGRQPAYVSTPSLKVPSRKIQAEAAFLAAIHNAHWYQSYALVLHYCSEALRHDPEIAKIMTQYLDLQTRNAPMPMCTSAEKIAESGSPQLQHYLLRYNSHQIDRILLGAVVDSLEKVGIRSRAFLNDLRFDEHSVSLKRRNLLDMYYSSASYQPQEVMWTLDKISVQRMRSHYYRAYSPESRFTFVGEASREVFLRICCRQPHLDSVDARITIKVNGEPHSSVSISKDWTTWDIEIPGNLIRDGMNDVVIHWPMPLFLAQSGIEAAAREIRHGLFPEFYQIFGEVHSFMASGCRFPGSSLEQCRDVLRSELTKPEELAGR